MFKGFTTSLTTRSPAPKTLQGLGVGGGRRVALVSDCAAVESADYPLAVELQKNGWKVTVLDTAKPGLPNRAFSGCAYHRLAGTYKETNWYIQMQSLTAYHWLRGQGFDTILFHHGFGAAFYSCMARFLGLAFEKTPILICVDETRASELEKDLEFPSGRNDFEIDFMERRAVMLSDGVIIGSPRIKEFMRETGWEFPRKAAKPANQKPVYISVCVATYNRPKCLQEALASLKRQGYAHFEVIVVDDGSNDPAVKSVRSEFAPLFKTRKWQWIRQKNKGPAAARNHAAKLAKGQYLLFMDDDDIAYPDELERFALAATRGGDVIACILGMHPETENGFPPTAYLSEREGKDIRPVGWTPIGGDIALTAFINVAGYAHSLYKRATFKKLGGFPVGKDSVFEDFELVTQALIAGCRIDVVPEVLMLYRRTKQSRSMGQDIFKGHLNGLKQLAALMPPPLRPLLLTIRQEWYRRHRQRRDGEI